MTAATPVAAHPTTAAAHLTTARTANKSHAKQLKLEERRRRDAARRADERDARRAAVQQLYLSNWGFITDAALADPRLTFQDADAIMRGVAHYLDEYSSDGDLTDAAFQQWVLDIIRPAVALCGREDVFSCIMRDSERHVYKAIWSVLKSCEDLGIADMNTVDAIAQDVWLWAMENFDKLIATDQPASPSTRLYRRAVWQARAEKKRALRHRKTHDSFTKYEDAERNRK